MELKAGKKTFLKNGTEGSARIGTPFSALLKVLFSSSFATLFAPVSFPVNPELNLGQQQHF